MILLIIVMFAFGIFLSAFFSGSETGFYRLTRVRIVLDALSGDRIARGLLWLTNRPSLFVATTLVGNNLANYMTSLATVMGTQWLLGAGRWPELVAPIVVAPLVFVYGELLPKNLFYQAPNRLLKQAGPLFLACTVLFLPVSLLLWALSKILERFIGSSPQRVQASLVRRELRRVIEEGHEVGILRPAQRLLAQGLFAVANQPLSQFTTPMYRLISARAGMSKGDALRLARQQRAHVLPVESDGSDRELIGYVRVSELSLDNSGRITPVRPLIDVPYDAKHIVALMQLESAGESLARVVSADGETVGIVTSRRLREPLFRGGR